MDAKEILAHHEHRGFPLPAKHWRHYQEWNQALFLHWKARQSALEPYLPAGVELDLFEGEAWLSMVAFSMNNLHPRRLPPVGFVSNFHELNIRTYVTRQGKPGVFFLSMEASKRFSNWLAGVLSGMPYRFAHIHYSVGQFRANHSGRNSRLKAIFQKGRSMTPVAHDLWLTERYAVHQEAYGKLKTFEVLHKPWDTYEVNLEYLELDYPEFSHLLQGPPTKVAFSPGVQTLAWDPY